MDIVKLGVEGVNRIWREAKLRAVGYKRAKTLVKLAEHSVGSHEAPNAARVEITNLICDYEMYIERMDLLMETIEQRLTEIPYIDKLLEIKGIGMITVCGFIAEVGDIRRFDNPKQLQKLAGYAIVNNSSGKHNGESHISYRGRKRLRYILYEAAISLVGKNVEFKEIHNYYLTRDKNPLKKMQSIIAVACKVIRIFYAILTKGIDYLANACRKKNLKIIHKLTAAAERTNRLAGMKTRERIKAIFGIDICICPVCSGEMHMIRRMEPKRLC